MSETAVYDPFGRILYTSPTWPAPFRYRGYWRDENSGLYLLPARAYSAELGRFLQRDPLGFPDGPNPYAYALHNPARMMDRLGALLPRTRLGHRRVGRHDRGARRRNRCWDRSGCGGRNRLTASRHHRRRPVRDRRVRLLILSAIQRRVRGRPDGSPGSAALAALGDVVGATNIYEGYTGEDAVTDRQLGGQERSERLGTGIGTGVATLAGGRSFRAGAGVAPKAVALAGSGSLHRAVHQPAHLGNPLVTGEYRTPNGMLLRSNMLLYRKTVGGKGITVIPLREGARNWWRSGSASEAYYTTLEESKGIFGHVFRHFVDNPNRVSPWTGNPQIHSVFVPEYQGSEVWLMDHAQEIGTSQSSNFRRHPVATRGENSHHSVGEQREAFGNYMGNPAATWIRRTETPQLRCLQRRLHTHFDPAGTP